MQSAGLAKRSDSWVHQRENEQERKKDKRTWTEQKLQHGDRSISTDEDTQPASKILLRQVILTITGLSPFCLPASKSVHRYTYGQTHKLTVLPFMYSAIRHAGSGKTGRITWCGNDNIQTDPSAFFYVLPSCWPQPLLQTSAWHKE